MASVAQRACAVQAKSLEMRRQHLTVVERYMVMMAAIATVAQLRSILCAWAAQTAQDAVEEVQTSSLKPCRDGRPPSIMLALAEAHCIAALRHAFSLWFLFVKLLTSAELFHLEHQRMRELRDRHLGIIKSFVSGVAVELVAATLSEIMHCWSSLAAHERTSSVLAEKIRNMQSSYEERIISVRCTYKRAIESFLLRHDGVFVGTLSALLRQAFCSWLVLVMKTTLPEKLRRLKSCHDEVMLMRRHRHSAAVEGFATGSACCVTVIALNCIVRCWAVHAEHRRRRHAHAKVVHRLALDLVDEHRSASVCQAFFLWFRLCVQRTCTVACDEHLSGERHAAPDTENFASERLQIQEVSHLAQLKQLRSIHLGAVEKLTISTAVGFTMAVQKTVVRCWALHAVHSHEDAVSMDRLHDQRLFYEERMFNMRQNRVGAVRRFAVSAVRQFEAAPLSAVMCRWASTVVSCRATATEDRLRVTRDRADAAENRLRITRCRYCQKVGKVHATAQMHAAFYGWMELAVSARFSKATGVDRDCQTIRTEARHSRSHTLARLLGPWVGKRAAQRAGFCIWLRHLVRHRLAVRIAKPLQRNTVSRNHMLLNCFNICGAALAVMTLHTWHILAQRGSRQALRLHAILLLWHNLARRASLRQQNVVLRNSFLEVSSMKIPELTLCR
eukprot:gnl/TRDRNA2_/TRDRNA2_160184_c2_seq1.p1 gnl/TRDRNA2_/TRDRNA2_160184_c2~~gnl/TRDRNA2_/TRDRNA2_160184_c2_seq1.p1  ORF type:complete len:716 (-),score=63.31 gnl/TRDRNA2_/TRDRNA2_160184_c2_seq1:22-2037(-)